MEFDNKIVWSFCLIISLFYFLWEYRYKIIIYLIANHTKKHFKELNSIYVNTTSFGLYTVAFIFEKYSEKIDAKTNGLQQKINEYFKNCLKKYHYPEKYIKDCNFVSQEECDKEANGSWYLYFRL